MSAGNAVSGDIIPLHHAHQAPATRKNVSTSVLLELWVSAELLFSSRLTWLLVLGPIALVGDATGLLRESACFVLAGVALIPCAERLSFVTEQVAAHTNGTIGALLNATFGNAPEFLISTAALRAGYYRVVQLTLLGSVLTNLLFVFGLSCLVGGVQWQVQELRITSGNVSVGMLLVATAGLLLPAALKMSGEIVVFSKNGKDNDAADGELAFSRWNSAIMMVLYMGYLTFQLGTHKEEFDEEQSLIETGIAYSPTFTTYQSGRKQKAKKNSFCLYYSPWLSRNDTAEETDGDVELQERGLLTIRHKTFLCGGKLHDSQLMNGHDHSSLSSQSISDEAASDPQSRHISLPFRDKGVAQALSNSPGGIPQSWKKSHTLERRRKNSSSSRSLPGDRRRSRRSFSKEKPRRYDADQHSSDESPDFNNVQTPDSVERRALLPIDDKKAHDSDRQIDESSESDSGAQPSDTNKEAHMSLRTGVLWLLVITLCISAMSDILVDTIDGFAYRYHISEVFTSVVIIPYFSNIAEQVSAVIFAYRNEMDLCIGITVGSAIQIALFVLPGCVLIGWVIDRSMSLFFRGYETCCLVLGVFCVSAVLQGGTTNWLVGMFFIGVYLMIALGFWFHELEDLSVDEELILHNATSGG